MNFLTAVEDAAARQVKSESVKEINSLDHGAYLTESPKQKLLSRKFRLVLA